MIKNTYIIFVCMGISGMLFSADSDDMPVQRFRKRGRDDASEICQVTGIGQKKCNVHYDTQVVSLVEQGELTHDDLQGFIQYTLEDAEYLFEGHCATLLSQDSSSDQDIEEDDRRYLQALKAFKAIISGQSIQMEYDERVNAVVFVFNIDYGDDKTLATKTMAYKNQRGDWVMQGSTTIMICNK